MRLGVLDVGSNTVHLLVVDAHEGARPMAAYSHKAELRLADHLKDGNRLSGGGAEKLRVFVGEALQVAEDKGVEELLSFATSAIRDAVNGEEVLARIRAETHARRESAHPRLVHRRPAVRRRGAPVAQARPH